MLLIYYSLAGLGSTVRGSQNTSTSTLSPPPLSSDASGAAGRPLQSFLFAGRRFVLPTPHRCVLPSTACSLVRPFVSSRIPPQTPVVASVLSDLFLLLRYLSLSLLSSFLSRLSSRLSSRLFSSPFLAYYPVSSHTVDIARAPHSPVTNCISYNAHKVRATTTTTSDCCPDSTSIILPRTTRGLFRFSFSSLSL